MRVEVEFEVRTLCPPRRRKCGWGQRGAGDGASPDASVGDPAGRKASREGSARMARWQGRRPAEGASPDRTDRRRRQDVASFAVIYGPMAAEVLGLVEAPKSRRRAAA